MLIQLRRYFLKQINVARFVFAFEKMNEYGIEKIKSVVDTSNSVESNTVLNETSNETEENTTEENTQTSNDVSNNTVKE